MKMFVLTEEPIDLATHLIHVTISSRGRYEGRCNIFFAELCLHKGISLSVDSAYTRLAGITNFSSIDNTVGKFDEALIFN